VQIRFRPPFLQIARHDARGDAVSLVMENMAQRGVPQWACYALAYEFVDRFASDPKLHTAHVVFEEGVYEVIDASIWCRQVISAFEAFMQELAAKDDLTLRGCGEKPDSFCLSVCALKNRKPKMEDRHIALPSLALVDPALSKGRKGARVAVFDGHHGHECAAYAAAHFPECLYDAKGAADLELKELLKVAFQLLDRRLTVRCEKENIRSGTTASCVYIEERVAYMAWCGDSSIGVLQSNKGIRTVSRRHTPNSPDERKRIEDAGGLVVVIQGELRVNGVLNISRSLGDIGAKPMISSVPDSSVYPITDGDFILFLASDGVWDQLSEVEIFDAVQEFIEAHPREDHEKLAEFITLKAKESGSSDNLTLLAVFLQPIDVIWGKFGRSG